MEEKENNKGIIGLGVRERILGDSTNTKEPKEESIEEPEVKVEEEPKETSEETPEPKEEEEPPTPEELGPEPEPEEKVEEVPKEEEPTPEEKLKEEPKRITTEAEFHKGMDSHGWTYKSYIPADAPEHLGLKEKGSYQGFDKIFFTNVDTHDIIGVLRLSYKNFLYIGTYVLGYKV